MPENSVMPTTLPAHAVESLLAHLDREETYFVRLSDAIRGLRQQPLSQGDDVWTALMEGLMNEAALLNRQRDAVRRLLQHATGLNPVSLSALPLQPNERRIVDRRRGEVRRVAASAAGLMRGWMITLSVWNDATSAALDALFGVSPQESTYSSTGARVPRTGRVLMESRS